MVSQFLLEIVIGITITGYACDLRAFSLQGLIFLIMTHGLICICSMPQTWSCQRHAPITYMLVQHQLLLAILSSIMMELSIYKRPAAEHLCVVGELYTKWNGPEKRHCSNARIMRPLYTDALCSCFAGSSMRHPCCPHALLASASVNCCSVQYK